MEDISLHILDIAENSVAAGATLIKIIVVEDRGKDLLSITVEDNGKGIPREILERVTDPFYTTRTTRKVGFGLSLLAQSAKETGGDITIHSEEGKGTIINASFSHSHIDRKPLGNIADSFSVLIAGNPEIDFILRYTKNGNEFFLDTTEIRPGLDGIPLNAPAVMTAVRDYIRESFDELKDRQS